MSKLITEILNEKHAEQAGIKVEKRNEPEGAAAASLQEEAEQCAICLQSDMESEPLNALGPCGCDKHYFHQMCIDLWKQHGDQKWTCIFSSRRGFYEEDNGGYSRHGFGQKR